MKSRLNKQVLLLTLVVLTCSLLLAGVACDSEIPLQIENRTDTVLAIYTQGIYDGQVEPNNTIKIKNLAAINSYYLIEARNSEGVTVYSRKFSFYELSDADWKVVIPPLPHK